MTSVRVPLTSSLMFFGKPGPFGRFHQQFTSSFCASRFANFALILLANDIERSAHKMSLISMLIKMALLPKTIHSKFLKIKFFLKKSRPFNFDRFLICRQMSLLRHNVDSLSDFLLRRIPSNQFLFLVNYYFVTVLAPDVKETKKEN